MHTQLAAFDCFLHSRRRVLDLRNSTTRFVNSVASSQRSNVRFLSRHLKTPNSGVICDLTDVSSGALMSWEIAVSRFLSRRSGESQVCFIGKRDAAALRALQTSRLFIRLRTCRRWAIDERVSSGRQQEPISIVGL